MRGLKVAVAFVGGAVTGGLVSYIYVTNRHKGELDEVRTELSSYYKDKVIKETELASSEAYEELDRVKTELNQMKEKVTQAMTNTVKKQTLQDAPAYIIRPDEFGMRPDYDKFYYTFCADDGKFYIDASMDTPAEAIEIDDMFQTLHPEHHFGEFEDDAVYVRNDDLKTDIAVYLADGPAEDIDE